MSIADLTRAVDQAAASMDRAIVASTRTNQVTAKADRVLERINENQGIARAARQREYQRMMGDFGARLKRIGLAVGLISIAAIGIGLFIPIGMFGFLAAVGLALGAAAFIAARPTRQIDLPTMPADVGNAEMVRRFDSYLVRTRGALPAPARAEVDLISAHLPDLEKVLSRIETMDPDAQEARRLMAKHLPGLIDRYAHVPAGYRDSVDGEGMTVDERLVDGLVAGRKALDELGERLAKKDVAAFETQGRFIKSRYGEKELD